MNAPRLIYLVGFMGCGKTSVGRRVAALLERSFLDLDEMITAAAGIGIRRIFEAEGESGFRRREASALAVAAASERAVVATGGGTVTADANRELMVRTGLQVFLDVPFELLARRVAEKAEDRPLFRDPESAFQLYSARLGFYRMADVTIRIAPQEAESEVAERVRLALPYRGVRR